MENKNINLGRKPRSVITIGIDCGSLSPHDEKEFGGVATVNIHLLEALAKLDKQNQYILYSYSELPVSLINKFAGRVKNIVLPKWGFKSIWLSLNLRFSPPTVFLATSQASPKTSVPVLGFIYDLAFLKYKHLYKTYKKLKHNTQELAQHTRHVVTISEASREDILKEFKIPSKQISVLYPGVSPQYSPKGPKYIDIKPYFLYVGFLKKTKNIPLLLEGFHLFLKNSKLDFHLICIGSDMDLDPQILATIKLLKMEKQVILKGYVKTNELPKYYRGAVAFISPSLYEGFGLPLVEAMACGTCVIGGNNSAMQEIIGKSGILVDESKAEKIGEAMMQIVENKNLRQKLVKSGLVQVKKYNWYIFAKGVLGAVYKYCV